MDKIIFFQNLGFNDYESKVLASFTKLNSATPKEIALDSGVPQNKTYSLLNKFKDLGILAVIPSDIKKYKLINLNTFINNKIKENEKRLRVLKENSKEIYHNRTDEKQFIFSLIKGQVATLNSIAEKNIKVKKEILGVQRNWKIWGSGLRAMKKAVKRGVKVKMIGLIDKNTKDRAEEWKKLGIKIKAYNKKFGENPLRFSIFDNKESRITIGKPEIQNPEEYITIWTSSKPLINILKKQFRDMWKESKSF